MVQVLRFSIRLLPEFHCDVFFGGGGIDLRFVLDVPWIEGRFRG